MLSVLTQPYEIAQIETYFHAQAIFKMPFRNTFPTLKRKIFKINLVPEGVILPKLTERFREFCALVSLGNIFQM